jgi:hypothetical protein
MTALSILLESSIPSFFTLLVALAVLAVAFMTVVGRSHHARRIDDRLRENLEPDIESFVGLVSVNGEVPRLGAMAIERQSLIVVQEGIDQTVEFDLQLSEVTLVPSQANGQLGSLTIRFDRGAMVQYSPLGGLSASGRSGTQIDVVRGLVEKAATRPSDDGVVPAPQ